MKRKKIVCVFCGDLADIFPRGEFYLVSCPECGRENELKAYQRMIEQMVDEKRKGAYAEKVMNQGQRA